MSSFVMVAMETWWPQNGSLFICTFSIFLTVFGGKINLITCPTKSFLTSDFYYYLIIFWWNTCRPSLNCMLSYFSHFKEWPGEADLLFHKLLMKSPNLLQFSVWDYAVVYTGLICSTQWCFKEIRHWFQMLWRVLKKNIHDC